jgi:hypothetical protein
MKLWLLQPEGVKNLPDILRQAKGISTIGAGQGDMSIATGLRVNLLRILATYPEYNAPCATRVNTPEQVSMCLEQGFHITITAPERTTSGLAEGRQWAAQQVGLPGWQWVLLLVGRHRDWLDTGTAARQRKG